MRPTKIFRHFGIYALTAGVSLTLGLLSFSGMFVLWPILPLAIAAFALAVAYEAEIYLQNIEGAFDWLYKRDHLKNTLANEFLLKNLKQCKQNETLEKPLFFEDYITQATIVAAYTHKKLTKAQAALRAKEQKKLRAMEKWFTSQLFLSEFTEKESALAKNLQAWLKKNRAQEHDALIKRHEKIVSKQLVVKVFSVIAGTFMGAGTVYLLIEAFPLLATLAFGWPLIIIPAAVLAGVAHGYLTYRNVMKMIKNDTLRKWAEKIHKYCTGELTVGKVLTVTLAILITSLAIMLTIFTAGTWLTVVQETGTFFSWMGGQAAWIIMGIINPIVEAFSALSFNTENALTTLDRIDKKLNPEEDQNQKNENINSEKENKQDKKSSFSREVKSLIKIINPSHWLPKLYPVTRDAALSAHHFFKELRKTENFGQMINPFRWFLKLNGVVRKLAFTAHLLSMSVSSDRAPGIPPVVSCGTAFICEGAEDAPYFTESEDCHTHDLDTFLNERLSEADHSHKDIPAKIINVFFKLICVPAAGLDWAFSQLNDGKVRPRLTLKEAWHRMDDVECEEPFQEDKKCQNPSTAWQESHVLYRIERFKRNHKEIQVEGKIKTDARTLDGLKFFDRKSHKALDEKHFLPLVLKEAGDYFATNPGL